LDASVVNVTSTLDYNQALGGGGDTGAGGGIANVLFAWTTVASSTITNNDAHGVGGGAGLGGGAYDDASSTLVLFTSLVTNNHANGAPGAGGGIYTVGTFIVDLVTVIEANHASTFGDNIGS
jgi:hypothetical protein